MPTLPTAPQQPTSIRAYSEYQSRLAGLIGLDVATMTASELLWLNAYFNNNSRTCWTYANWFDLCPMGEARFINNSLSYPNDLTQTAFWPPVGFTVTRNATLTNPLDGRVNISKLLEIQAYTFGTSTAQSFAAISGVNYTASVIVRPIGGRCLKLTIGDGSTTYFGSFDLTTGAIIATSTSGVTAASAPLANGFFLCQVSITAATSASVGSGSYALTTVTSAGAAIASGDATKGLYVYGCQVTQTSNLADTANLLPWIQAGEPEIDAFYTAWRNAPYSANSPTKIGYSITNNGIQLIGSTWNNGYLLTPSGITTTTSGMAGVLANPVYIYYRVAPFSYFGAAWTAILTYAIGDIVQFTNATSGVINYYTCLAATTAGQSPVTNPSSWQLNWIPDVLFQYCVYKGYADWLRTDGQFDKANAQEGLAQTILENEFDTQEREMGMSAPLRVQTHLTSR